MQSELTKKVLWGILAFSPWIIFLTVFPILLFGFHIAPGLDEQGRLDLIGKVWLIGYNLYILFVYICYFVYIGNLKDMKKGKQWLWRGLTFVGHVYAIPIFWYLHIWKNTDESSRR